MSELQLNTEIVETQVEGRRSGRGDERAGKQEQKKPFFHGDLRESG
jgi:hypothetical protein